MEQRNDAWIIGLRNSEDAAEKIGVISGRILRRIKITLLCLDNNFIVINFVGRLFSSNYRIAQLSDEIFKARILNRIY